MPIIKSCTGVKENLHATFPGKTTSEVSMNDRQLYSFCLAVKLKSFSKAAEASYISTSAFAQQIRLLEKEIGFSLFIRSPQGITLTPSGESFYEAAKEMLRIYEEACERGKELAREKPMTLRLACPWESLPDFVTDAPRLFSKEYPHVEILFIPTPFPRLMEEIQAGRADIGFLAEPDPMYLKNLCFLPLLPETFSFCVRPGHPLSQKEMLTAEELKGYTVLCGQYDYLKAPFEESLPPFVTCKKLGSAYDYDIQMKSLLGDELIIIHSRWGKIYRQNLVVIPSNIPAGWMGAIYHKKPSFVRDAFLRCLKEHLGEPATDAHS